MTRSGILLSLVVLLSGPAHSIAAETPPSAAEEVALRLADDSDPWLRLTPGTPVPTRFKAPPGILESQRPDHCSPTAAGVGDLDEDGMADLVVALECSGDPRLAVHRGNIDLLFPNAPEARARRAAGESCDDAFLPEVRLHSSPLVADFLTVGDMDADGHADVVVARRGGTHIEMLAGDGLGDLQASRSLDLSGRLTAWASGDLNRRDGLPDLAVAVSGPSGSELLVLEHPGGAMRAEPESFELPTAATAVEIAALDGDHFEDIAVAAGDRLLLISGRDRKLSLDRRLRSRVGQAAVAVRTLAHPVADLAAGRFRGGVARDLAVLSADGGLTVLVGDDVPMAGWREEMLAEVTAIPQDGLRLLRTRTSSRRPDDLLVMEPALENLALVQPNVTAENAIARATRSEIAMSDTPVAVVPMRLNGDALDDLVVLRHGDARPTVALTTAARSFIVNDSGNDDDINHGSGDDVCLTEAGTCTLRAAIQAARQLDGLTNITFSVSSALLDLNTTYTTKPVTIDGTSQGLVQVTGDGAAISIRGGSSAIRGLSIGDLTINFLRPGEHSTGNVFEGNHVGLNVTLEDLNYAPGVAVQCPDNLVGGTVAAARNIISAQGSTSLAIFGTDVTDVKVKGNWIGPDATGEAPFADGRGIYISGNASACTIGGTEPGAGNVVAGVDGDGVLVRSGSGTIVQGNRIGTNPDGTVALGNEIGLSLGTESTTVGGTSPAARNLISGNHRDGLYLRKEANDALIQGNFIGIDASGTTDLGNAFQGIVIWGASRVGIGGVAEGAGNVISGNDSSGIVLNQSLGMAPEDVFIQGNLIGTDASGAVAIGNGTSGSSSWGDGVNLEEALRPVIGGTEAAARNIISGNVNHGVEVRLNAEHASINGNLIGTAADGGSPLGNGHRGVYFHGATPETFEGIGLERANTIAFNGEEGIFVGSSATGVEIRYNKIFDNEGLGIALTFSTVNNNDTGDPDGGGNDGQNYPVLTGAAETGVTGTLDSEASTEYVIDVYVNNACDPSGHGEAETWLGETTVTTDGNGHGSFSLGFSAAGGFLAATATDPDGNTSELSACLEIAPDTTDRTVRLTAVDTTVKAGSNAALRVEVVKEDDGTVDQLFSGSVTVKMAAGSTAGVGALIVGGGQRSQQVTVPVSQGVGLLSLGTPAVELTPASVITPTTVLEGTAIVTADLGDGKTSTASVEVTSPLDLWVERIEVQQGLRVTPNETSERFVRERMILIRTYIGSNGNQFGLYDRIEGLSIELTFLGKGGVVISGPTAFRRSVRLRGYRGDYVHRRTGVFTKMELLYGLDSFNALFPAKTEELTIQIKLVPDFPDLNRANDDKSIGPMKFVYSEPITIAWSRTRYESSETTTTFPSMQGISKQMGRLFDLYPLSDGNLKWLEQPNQVVTEDPLPKYHDAALTKWLSAVDDANVIAWVHFVDSAFIRLAKGWENARGYAHVAGHLAVVDSETALPPENAPSITAHEVGHILGLGDTYSVKDKNGKEIGGHNPDINPRRADALLTGNLVEAGAFRFYEGYFEVDGDRHQMTDFMGNGPDSHYDMTTLRYLQDAFLPVRGSRPSQRIGLLQPNRAEMASEELILVRGVASPDGTVQLSPFYTLEAAGLRSDPGNGSYAIETVNSAGAAIDTVRFEPDFFVTNIAIEAKRSFEAALPFDASVDKVRVMNGQTKLAEIQVSDTTPTVTLNPLPQGSLSGTVQVSWSGSDADGDDLLYSLFYSPDGAVKMPVVVETSSTSAAWNVDDYPSGTAPVLAVYVTDGTRSSEDPSTVLDVPDRDPEVIISSPADGMRIRSGDIVVLTAEIIDPEKGFMPLADVDWTSSRDGALGTGISLEVASLSLGQHTLTATFTDSASNVATDQVTIEVTNGPVCSLTCEPVVPASAVFEVSTALDAGITAESCLAAPQVHWEFGDDRTSDQLTTNHSWSEPGSYSWSLNAIADGVECSAQGLIEITAGEETHHYLIPASAHAPGAQGTQWVTDAVLHNPGGQDVWATVYFHERDQDNTTAVRRVFRVLPGVSVNLADIVLAQFGKAKAAAALRVGATGELVVSSRTYNDASSGTYGQYIAGFDETEALSQGDEARLIQLSSDADFRTNIGLASATDSTITIELELYDADGTLLAKSPVTLGPLSYVQLNNVFAGMGDIEGGYAVISSASSGALYLTYASVVDNGSGDPVYVYPVKSVSGSGSGPTCGLDSWQDLNPGGATADTLFVGLVSSGSVYLVFGSEGMMLRSTDSGTTWIPVTTGTNATLYDGVWNGSYFVVVGEGGLVMTSIDGVSWTIRNSRTTESLWGIAWGGGQFVAVGSRATLLTSPDGVNWTSHSNPSDPTQSLWGVGWHDGRWIVVGTAEDRFDAGSIMTSSSGVHWTLGTLPAAYGMPYRVKWLNGRWVTVGVDGYIASSPDGIAWTLHDTGSTSDLLGIVWNGETYAISTSYRRVLTSPELSSWTSWEVPAESQRLQNILWTGTRHIVCGKGGILAGTVCSGDELVVTTTANAGGLLNTRWTTDLDLHNSAAQSSSVDVELLKRDHANPDPATVTVTVEPGESLHVENPLEQYFQHSGTAALRLTPTGGELSASSRTYNTATAGTFGQFIPAVPASHAIEGGEEARLVQLSRSADKSRGFRTNVGLVNLGTDNITVLIDLYRGDGTHLGQTDVFLREGEHRQLTDVFGAVTAGDVDEGYAVLSCETAAARYLAYASVVDNRSGDPIYIPAR